MPSVQLFVLLEVPLLRCLLVKKVQREKYSHTNQGLLFKVMLVNKNICEGRVEIKIQREKRDTLKTLTKETTIEALF